MTWTASSSPDVTANDQVVLYDLETKSQRVVATPGKAGGVTDWSRVSGPIVAYTDQDEIQREENGYRSPWKIVAVNTSTNDRRLLDQDRTAQEQDFRPTVELSYPWAAWARPSSSEGAYDLLVGNLDTGATRTILRDANVESLIISGGTVYFTLGTPNGSDLYSLPIQREASPTKLSSSSSVSGVGKSTGRSIVFEEVARSETGTPRSRVLRWRPGDGVEVLADNLYEGANPTAGASFAAWYSDAGSITVRSLTGHGSTTITPKVYPSIAGRMSADGDQLVWAELRDLNNPRAAEVVIGRVDALDTGSE